MSITRRTFLRRSMGATAAAGNWDETTTNTLTRDRDHKNDAWPTAACGPAT